jgi:tetrahydromethanopterin S-methyltransferase subunit F
MVRHYHNDNNTNTKLECKKQIKSLEAKIKAVEYRSQMVQRHNTVDEIERLTSLL